MKRWPTKPLGDLVSLEYGKALKAEERSTGGRYPVYGSNGIVGSHDEAVVKRPTIVVGRKGAIGEVHLAEKGCWPIDTAFYTVFRQPEIISLRYLLLWFRSVDLKSLGITATIPGLNRNTLYAQQVPMPPLAEQERIVKLLDEADKLKKLRTEATSRTAALIPALFDQMFGDPIANPKKWSVSSIGKIALVETGRTPSRTEPANFDGKIPWVKTTEVNGIVIADTQEKLTEKGFRSVNGKLFPPSSIVVAMYGQGKTRGQSALLGIEAFCNQACAVILPSEHYETGFLFSYFQISYARLRALSRGGNQENLNLNIVRSFNVPLPPLALQKEFAQRVAEIRELEAGQAASRRRLEELFQSLLHRAFNGEL